MSNEKGVAPDLSEFFSSNATLNCIALVHFTDTEKNSGIKFRIGCY